MTSTQDRYDGNPMLRLMDSYVLDAIGALDEKSAVTLQKQAPVLAKALNVKAESWQSIVEQAMGMPEDSQETLIRAWNTYQQELQEHDSNPEPMEFAQIMVDHVISED